jgi:hypothetical protein
VSVALAVVETGVTEIDRALAILADLGGRGADLLGVDGDSQDLAARSTVAMVAFSTTIRAAMVATVSFHDARGRRMR